MSQIKNKFDSIIKRRADFPSLNREINGYPLAYLDGPGGTQIPKQVIDAMVHYYENCNANHDGRFLTSIESDKIIHQAREHMAAFLGAKSWESISFGANMTTLAYSLSNAFVRHFNSCDEILITQLDHEANRGPWLNLKEHGLIIKEAKIKNDGTLDYDNFKQKITNRTRLVAVGMASNALGTVNDLQNIRRWTLEVGAWLLVDAVHYAPHFAIDVQKLGVDFLFCSAYKFYGPHVGILYTKEGMLDQLSTDCLRTQDQKAPYKIETGTLNHAALAGVKAAVGYIASFGKGDTLRKQVISAMELISEFEHELAKKYYDGVNNIDGLDIYGPDMNDKHRAPTVSFAMSGLSAAQICQRLNEKGICAWDGHFYAIRPVEVLGLVEKGGLTRVGVSLYNTEEEIERVLEELKLIS